MLSSGTDITVVCVCVCPGGCFIISATSIHLSCIHSYSLRFMCIKIKVVLSRRAELTYWLTDSAQHHETKQQNHRDVVTWGYTTDTEAIVWYKALLEGESVSRCDTLGDLEICLAEEQRAGRKCRRHTEQNIFKHGSKTHPPPVFSINSVSQWVWLLVGHWLH